MRCDVLYLWWLDIIICGFYAFFPKDFLKTCCLTYVLSVFPPQVLVLRCCSLVKEGRHGYFVVLHGVLITTSHHTPKELVGKRMTPLCRRPDSKGRQVHCLGCEA